ncbi:hypothetical protein, partial [Enterobacter hormaechei]
PGELKIFHGGTPVLGPPPAGPPTKNRFGKTNTLKKKKQTIRDAAHTPTHNQITKDLTPPLIFTPVVFFSHTHNNLL